MSPKQKIQVLPPGRHVRKLDSVGAVLGEMGRVYRLGVNGKIGLDEAGKRIYMLDRIRSTVEARDAQLELIPGPTSFVNVTITPVMAGSYLSETDIADFRAGKMPPLALANPEPPAPPGEPVNTTIDDATIVTFPSRRAEEFEPEPDDAA